MSDTTTTDVPDLVASTGTNDSNSPWGLGLLQTAVQSGLSLGTTALTGALQQQTPVNAAAASGAPSGGAAQAPVVQQHQSFMGAWIIWGLIAVATVWFLLRRAD